MATVSSSPLSDPALLAAAGRSKAWPFEEAKKIVARIEKRKDASQPVIF